SFDMELRDEELAIVLSMVDRLNDTRTMLRALTAAVQSQPAEVRDAILAEMRALLDCEPTAAWEARQANQQEDKACRHQSKKFKDGRILESRGRHERPFRRIAQVLNPETLETDAPAA